MDEFAPDYSCYRDTEHIGTMKGATSLILTVGIVIGSSPSL